MNRMKVGYYHQRGRGTQNAENSVKGTSFCDDNKLGRNETANRKCFVWNSIISGTVPSQAANVIQHNAICAEAPSRVHHLLAVR